MESWSVWERAIGSLGFPIFVAVYMLVRSDQHVRQLTRAIEELTRAFKEGRS